jgi:flavin reductase (DIM6/NTAB) family NADH-FMN oxidoreductase RutF
MSSLSMDPPMLLVCLNKTSETGGAVLKAQSFAVNILADARSIWPASSRSRVRTSSPASLCTPD